MIDGELDYIGEARARLGEDGAKVVKGLPRLGVEVVGADEVASRVERFGQAEDRGEQVP